MDGRNTNAIDRLLPTLITDTSNVVGKESLMLTIPSAAQSLFLSFSIGFTRPTFERVVLLAVGAILATGRRTVTAILWTMRGLVTGHTSTYHRVLSRAVWSLWPLGKILAGVILSRIAP